METCNNVGIQRDLLVKQFDCSMKENAFDWYIDLKFGLKDSWEQLK